MTARVWSMARAWRSAWCWRTASPRASNLASPDDADRVERASARGRPADHAWPTFPASLPGAERCWTYIAQDKKVSRGALTFILTRGIGQAFIARDVPPSEVLRLPDGETSR